MALEMRDVRKSYNFSHSTREACEVPWTRREQNTGDLRKYNFLHKFCFTWNIWPSWGL